MFSVATTRASGRNCLNRSLLNGSSNNAAVRRGSKWCIDVELLAVIIRVLQPSGDVTGSEDVRKTPTKSCGNARLTTTHLQTASTVRRSRHRKSIVATFNLIVAQVSSNSRLLCDGNSFFKVRLHFVAGCTTGWTKRFEYSYKK